MDLLTSMRIAVIVKPTEQKISSGVEPIDWRIAPARTEAMGIMPWEPMLVMLLTLLSISLSTTRMRAVLVGMFMNEILINTLLLVLFFL